MKYICWLALVLSPNACGFDCQQAHKKASALRPNRDSSLSGAGHTSQNAGCDLSNPPSPLARHTGAGICTRQGGREYRKTGGGTNLAVVVASIELGRYLHQHAVPFVSQGAGRPRLCAVRRRECAQQRAHSLEQGGQASARGHVALAFFWWLRICIISAMDAALRSLKTIVVCISGSPRLPARTRWLLFFLFSFFVSEQCSEVISESK